MALIKSNQENEKKPIRRKKKIQTGNRSYREKASNDDIMLKSVRKLKKKR